MAQSYLQSKQAGAYSSLNSLMDIQAKLDAKQQEYEQRKEAQKEISKANTRSLGAQGALLYGIYNYPEISSGLSNLFTDSAATQTTPAEFGMGFNQGGQPVTVAPPNQLIQLPSPSAAPVSSVSATPAATVAPIAPAATPAIVPTATPAIAPSALPTASATPVIAPTASTATTTTGAITPALQAGTDTAATATGISSIAPAATTEATTATAAASGSSGAVGGAMSGAMVGAGSALGIGMGAYDMSQNGVTVGNASSVIGGTIMASSFAFPPAAPVLVPVGAGIMIGGNILSAVFGW